MKSFTGSLAVLGVCIGSLALSQSALAQSDKRFDRADANHDGRVSLEEFESYVGGHLMRSKSPRAQKFRALDPEQQAEVLQRRFQKLDKEHKGYLAPGDFQRHQG